MTTIEKPWNDFACGRTDTISRGQLTALLRECQATGGALWDKFPRDIDASTIAWHWLIGTLGIPDLGTEPGVIPGSDVSAAAVYCTGCGANLNLPGSVAFPIPGTNPAAHICAVCEDRLTRTDKENDRC